MGGARDPRQRFTDRVDNYVRWRPRYPSSLVELVRRRCGLLPEHVVADVGSGTGFLSEPFLQNGNRVFGVEPNAAMREAAERLLASFPAFESVAGSAEATGLPEGSIDLVAAGQAFHWFDPPAARREFQRILKPGGWVALVWNDRRTEATAFLRGYEELLQRFGTDYGSVSQKNVTPSTLRAFYGTGGYEEERLENAQRFDLEGLEGRLLSSSYAPGPGHPDHLPMLRALRGLFEAHAEEGKVVFVYDTRVLMGHLSPAGGGE